MKWYLKVLKQYADFGGRSSRKEYWMFVLFHTVFLILAIIIDRATGWGFGNLLPKYYPSGIPNFNSVTFGIVTQSYYTVMLLPALALMVRRLHDVGKSGWFLFISLIPVIGGIWLLVLTLSRGDRYTNTYGSEPVDASVAPWNVERGSGVGIIVLALYALMRYFGNTDYIPANVWFVLQIIMLVNCGIVLLKEGKGSEITAFMFAGFAAFMFLTTAIPVFIHFVWEPYLLSVATVLFAAVALLIASLALAQNKPVCRAATMLIAGAGLNLLYIIVSLICVRNNPTFYMPNTLIDISLIVFGLLLLNKKIMC